MKYLKKSKFPPFLFRRRDVNICSSDFLVRYRFSRQGTDFVVKVQIFSSRYRFFRQGTDFLVKVQKISSGTEIKLGKVMVKTFHQVPMVHRSTVFITKNDNVVYTTLYG